MKRNTKPSDPHRMPGAPATSLLDSKPNFPGYDPRKFVTTRVTFMTRASGMKPAGPIRVGQRGDWRENLTPAAMPSWITDSQFVFVATDDFYTILTFSKPVFSHIEGEGIAIWTDYASRQVQISDADFGAVMRWFMSQPDRLVTHESVEVDFTGLPQFRMMN